MGGREDEGARLLLQPPALCIYACLTVRGDEGTRGRGNEITLLSAFRAQNVIVMVIVLPSLQGEGYGGASVTRDGVGVRLPLTFYIYTESQRFIIKEGITMGCENL